MCRSSSVWRRYIAPIVNDLAYTVWCSPFYSSQINKQRKYSEYFRKYARSKFHPIRIGLPPARLFSMPMIDTRILRTRTYTRPRTPIRSCPADPDLSAFTRVTKPSRSNAESDLLFILVICFLPLSSDPLFLVSCRGAFVFAFDPWTGLLR